jgi:hypothetical protein
MRLSRVISKLSLAVLLAVFALVAGVQSADAHAGHGPSTELSAQVSMSSVKGVSHEDCDEARARAQQENPAAAPCTANCCAAGMGCCAALMVFPMELRAPHELLSLRDLAHDNRTGIEPDVPLKPPRLARDQCSLAA